MNVDQADLSHCLSILCQFSQFFDFRNAYFTLSSLRYVRGPVAEIHGQVVRYLCLVGCLSDEEVTTCTCNSKFALSEAKSDVKSDFQYMRRYQ